jgi:hypothetical protein
MQSWFRFVTKIFLFQQQRPKSHFVILNAVKNLVLYAGAPLFLDERAGWKEGVTQVLEDEILHCVQNDKVEFWVPRKGLPSTGG